MFRDDVGISCSGDGIEELANLNSIKVLKILNLEFVRGGIEAKKAKLTEKTNLCELSLNWLSIFKEDHEMSFHEVLEGLEPHPNLRKLELCKFPGLKFPKWMGLSNCLSNLTELRLWDCGRCDALPALGMLTCLKVLHIWKMKSVQCLGEEFYYQHEEEEENINCSSSIGSCNTKTASTTSLFPSLIHLSIEDMENLKEWFAPFPTYNSFSSLEKLEIGKCPKLRSTPKSFSFLKELDLIYTNIKEVTPILATGRLTYHTSIFISYSSNLIYVPLCLLLQNSTPNLQNLRIMSCSKLQGFRDDDNDLNNNNNDEDSEAVPSFSCPKINSNSNNSSNSFRLLHLSGCPVLTLLPDLRLLTSLRKLTIWQCDKLKQTIPYNLKSSLTFLEVLRVDFTQNEDEHLEDPAANN